MHKAPETPTWIQYRLLATLAEEGGFVRHVIHSRWQAGSDAKAEYRVHNNTVQSLYRCGLLDQTERAFFEGNVLGLSKRGRKYLERLQK